MKFNKMTKADIVKEYSKVEKQYAFAQGQAIELENELIQLIIRLLEVFKNAPAGTGLWGWIKVVWSSEFRKALVDLINYIKEHRLNKNK
jgi:hypothetical protein